MKKLLATALTALLIMACGSHADDKQTALLYQTLDSLIEHHDEIVASRGTQIISIAQGLQSMTLTP